MNASYSSNESYSANTDDLDGFAERSVADARALAETYNSLLAQRSVLAAAPLPFFVDQSHLAEFDRVIRFVDENGSFARDISSALTTQETVQNTALVGYPATSPYGTALAELAESRGVTVEELEQARRAFAWNVGEIGTLLVQHFDTIAGLAGRGGGGRDDQIDRDDLFAALEDESLPQEIRDIAYRLAADAVLFDNLDGTKQTDLTREPLGNGFDLSNLDGIIGRDDVEQFPAKSHQARILLAWHPLIETAGDGYDLTRANSHASDNDVIAFIGDDDIPVYVRLAVFDVYADKFNLDLKQRQVLEQELAFHAGSGVSGFGGRTTLEATPGQAPGHGPSLFPGRPGAAAGPKASPAAGAGTGPGSAGAAAVYAELLKISGGAGWQYGTQKRIERDGKPTFIHTNPITGHEASLDPSELAGLSPAETKAWVAHFSATGKPPLAVSDAIEQHPYLDPAGQWRLSDTNQPINNIDPDETRQPIRIPENPDHYYDTQGELRWKDTNQRVQDLPNRPKHQDPDGTWRWTDTRAPVHVDSQEASSSTSSTAGGTDIASNVAGQPGGSDPASPRPHTGDVIIRDRDYAPVPAPGRPSHAIDGNINGLGRASGGHYTRSANLLVLRAIDVAPNGVIKAEIAIRGPGGRWVTKTDRQNRPIVNTLFPQHWNRRRVLIEIDTAFKRSVPRFTEAVSRHHPPPRPPTEWQGRASNGTLIRGRYNRPGDPSQGWVSAYPVFEGR